MPKRFNIYSYLLCIGFLFSCQSGETIESEKALPSNLFSFQSVLDIGNNNNASDIRIEAKVLEALMENDIVEIRMIIAKSSQTLSELEVKSILSDRYFQIPISKNPTQVYKPKSSLKDSDGDVIANNIHYTVYIGIIGKGTAFQLEKSKEFSLSNAPIYAGDYIGSWEDLGPPGPAKFDMSLRIASDYQGQIFYANANFKPFGKGTEDATVIMEIVGQEIKSFRLNQFILGYGTNDCIATSTISGNITDDTVLSLHDFQWTDCDGSRLVKLTFRKIL
ncbi:MAG: hypothetical protein ABI844_02715 [Saprospiraceae bacterium]